MSTGLLQSFAVDQFDTIAIDGAENEAIAAAADRVDPGIACRTEGGWQRI